VPTGFAYNLDSGYEGKNPDEPKVPILGRQFPFMATTYDEGKAVDGKRRRFVFHTLSSCLILDCLRRFVKLLFRYIQA
jgi:hypothetical protein